MSLIALLTAGIVGYSVYLTGAFNVSLSETPAPVEVSTSGNPLMVIVNAVTKISVLHLATMVQFSRCCVGSDYWFMY